MRSTRRLLRTAMAVQRAWVDAATRVPAIDRSPSAGEGFASGTHAFRSRGHRYKIYIPPEHAGHDAPLIVMLHGCTQNPDSFAASTRMNALAREKGCFILYPEQSLRANRLGCWNWFVAHHQGRGRGEPSMIASMTKAIVARYGIDRQGVFIAGFSEGFAMAAITGAAYPEIFAAIGTTTEMVRSFLDESA